GVQRTPHAFPTRRSSDLAKFKDNEKLLKGFDWRDAERPKSVEDLFKDDPPLNLPVIKGLDDYVPQEDFFDEDVLKRIDKANEAEKTSAETDKASRNLPKRVKNRTENKLITPATDKKQAVN